jgi:hypothetical protein
MTDGLEPLTATSRYVAWAETLEATVALGELMLGEELAVAASAAAPLEEIRSLLVTEEDMGATLPATPSELTRMRGSVGAILDFLPVPEEALEEASSEARIEDDHFFADTHGLPKLGPGLHYAVWAEVPDSMQHNPEMSRTDEGDEGHEKDEEAAETPMAIVGKLDAAGKLEASFPSLATATVLAITVESDRGSPRMSPVRCLHGEVRLPVSQGQQTVHSH